MQRLWSLGLILLLAACTTTGGNPPALPSRSALEL
jgi:hypothetical protein